MLNVRALIELSKKQKLEYIGFWGEARHNQINHGVFSNFTHAGFEIDGLQFTCVEQWMMYSKAVLFDDQASAAEIYNMPFTKPFKYKNAGKKVKKFKDNVWNQHKIEIVRKGVYAKFSQNEELKKHLLSTGDKVLVEASPKDNIWGIGMDSKYPNMKNPLLWKGQNLLGFILMDVRDQIMSENAQ